MKAMWADLAERMKTYKPYPYEEFEFVGALDAEGNVVEDDNYDDEE